MLPALFITVVVCLVINMPIGYALGIASAAALVFTGNEAQDPCFDRREVSNNEAVAILGDKGCSDKLRECVGYRAE